jgi:clan AA aspartic protease
MGTIYAEVTLSNLLRADLQPVRIDALVDSGAINLCIPDIIRRELGLEVARNRVTEMADGSLVEVGVVEPVTVKFENRVTTTTAMVLGTEVLLGAIPMQDMDVLIDPRNERLILPPERPNFALSKVK